MARPSSLPIANDGSEAQRPSGKAEIVLRAASKVFLAHGFSASTTDMIQCEAGVSKATVYAHYPNKEELFAAVIERQCALLAGELKNIAVQPGNLRHALTALGRAYLDTVLAPEGLALFRVVVAEAPRFPQLARTFYTSGPQAVAHRAREHLSAACKAGELDLTAIGLDAAGHAFIGLVRNDAQMHYLTHTDARPSTEQIDRWVDNAVTTFLLAFGRADRAGD